MGARWWADNALIAALTDRMLRAGAARWQKHLRLHKVVIAAVRRGELCRRFMRIPGVGAISALTFRTSIDDPPGSAAPRRSARISV